MNFKAMFKNFSLKNTIVKYVLIGLFSLVMGILIHIWKKGEVKDQPEE